MSRLKPSPTTFSVVMLLSLGCASSSQPPSQSGASWTHHQDKAGFEVQLPKGWATEAAKDGHVLIHSQDETSFTLLQPFKLSNGGTASESIKTLIEHMKELFPDAHISAENQVEPQPDVVTAKVAFGAKSRANVLCCLDHGAGMFYAIAAPQNSFGDEKGMLVKILQSFKYTAAAAPDGSDKESDSGPLTYTNWTDPKEAAFSVDVPSGWKVMGGLFRFAPIDVRRQINLASPDGQVQIQAGDARVSTYVPYGPSAQVRGLRENQSYQVNGVSYTILHYMPGAEYAKKYVEVALKKDHPDLKIGDSKERQDLQDWARQKFAAPKLSVGQTDFTYTEHGQAFQGVVIGTTVDSGQGLSEIWQGLPATVCATPERMTQGLQVLTHMLQHTTDSDSWNTQQLETTKEFNQLVMQNHEKAMAQLQETYQKFTSWLKENQREWSNVINNQVDVRDASGGTFKVEAGHNYYWSGANGIVGTDSKSAPDINLTPLTKF